jgi:transketolase
VRYAFVETLLELAEADPRIVLVTGDLGFGVLETFAARFPAQFLNAGVAEQNMTGVAAGLALSGHVVFTYSIANFPTLRCLEQIRNDVCIHRANVTVVAVGGGLAYGVLGATHHGTEDLAVMSALPGMTVFAPGDPVEAALATRAAATLPGPCYLRLGKAGEPVVHTTIPPFRVGEAIRVRSGDDATLVTTGATLALAVAAAGRLADRGIDAGVLSMPTLQPLDRHAILDAAARTRRVVTVEEHGVGGLGAAVAEVLASVGHPVPLRMVRLPRQVIETVGSQAHLRACHGLSLDDVIAAVEAP